MLYIKKNQPINFGSIAESINCDPDCGATESQCRTYKYGEDWLSFQFGNTARHDEGMTGLCDSGSLIYGNTFTAASYGQMTVTNMTWNAGGEKFVKASGIANINITTNYFVSGHMYKVRVKISGATGNELINFVEYGVGILGEVTPDFDGWFEVVFLSGGNNVEFQISGTATQAIEDFEIIEIGSTLTIGAGWLPSFDTDTPNGYGVKWIFDNASASSLISASTMLSGRRYRINFRVSNYSAGSVTLSAGNYSEAFTSNGYFTRWIEPTTSGSLTFIADAGSKLSIEVIQYGEQAKTHPVSLYTSAGVFVADLTFAGLATRDVYSVLAYLSSIDMTLGCFKICIYDAEIVFGSGDQLQGALDFNTTTGITTTGDVVAHTGLGLLLIKEGGDLTIDLAAKLIDGGCYLLEIVFRNYVDTICYADSLKIYYSGQEIYSNVLIDGSAGTIIVPFTAGATTNVFYLWSDTGAGTDVEIESIRVFQDPACGIAIPPTYCSDCIAVVDDAPCTRIIASDMELMQNPVGVTMWKTAFGFDFNGIFLPMMRVKAVFHSFNYPSDVESFVNNVGTYQIINAQLQKEWKLSIAQLTQADLDAIRMMIHCDQLRIYSNDSTTVETYFCASKDLSPQWTKKENPSCADIEIEVRQKYNSDVFNQNIIHTY